MPSSNPSSRFGEIVHEIDLIRAFIAHRSAAQVSVDLMAVRALERSLQIISEAAVKLGDHAERVAPAQPWRKIRSLGNVLRHDYQEVAFDQLWATIKEDLDSLRADCAAQLPAD